VFRRPVSRRPLATGAHPTVRSPDSCTTGVVRDNAIVDARADPDTGDIATSWTIARFNATGPTSQLGATPSLEMECPRSLLMITLGKASRTCQMARNQHPRAPLFIYVSLGSFRTREVQRNIIHTVRIFLSRTELIALTASTTFLSLQPARRCGPVWPEEACRYRRSAATRTGSRRPDADLQGVATANCLQLTGIESGRHVFPGMRGDAMVTLGLPAHREIDPTPARSGCPPPRWWTGGANTLEGGAGEFVPNAA
jgi:hypothetical protein